MRSSPVEVPAKQNTTVPAAQAREASPAAAQPRDDVPSPPAPGGFGARVRRILARIVDPFGSTTPPASEDLTPDQRRYKEFLAQDLFSGLREPVAREVARLRGMKTKEERADYLRQVGAAIVARIQAERGVGELGFHYNLHGGWPEAYIDGGGIRANQGDIMLQYSMQGDLAHKVYFFRSSKFNLYDVLNERNPNLFGSRMGNVLNVFDADSDYMKKALAAGAASHPTSISVDFAPEAAALNRYRIRGIPYDTYLAPPLKIFPLAQKRLGLGRLSRDEETLAVMRYIEAAVFSGGAATTR